MSGGRGEGELPPPPPPDECVFVLCVVVYEAVVDDDEVEICCCNGEGETTLRCENEDPRERTDAGEVGERTWREGGRGERSRSDELYGSGEACLETDGEAEGEWRAECGPDGVGRRGIAGRAWCGSR